MPTMPFTDPAMPDQPALDLLLWTLPALNTPIGSRAGQVQ